MDRHPGPLDPDPEPETDRELYPFQPNVKKHYLYTFSRTFLTPLTLTRKTKQRKLALLNRNWHQNGKCIRIPIKKKDAFSNALSCAVC